MPGRLHVDGKEVDLLPVLADVPIDGEAGVATCHAVQLKQKHIGRWPRMCVSWHIRRGAIAFWDSVGWGGLSQATGAASCAPILAYAAPACQRHVHVVMVNEVPTTALKKDATDMISFMGEMFNEVRKRIIMRRGTYHNDVDSIVFLLCNRGWVPTEADKVILSWFRDVWACQYPNPCFTYPSWHLTL